MTFPLVSIINVNYNGKNYLEKCLESLTKVKYSNLEIIIVDNNSTDESIEFVKNQYPSIIIIKLDKNHGFAEPNNIGVKNARGDFLLFLNNDTIVTPNFIDEMVNVACNDTQIAICQSLLLLPNGDVDSSGDFIDKLGVAYNSKMRVEKVKEIFSARGASMLVRRNVFEKLGGFDKKFFVSFEDVDFGWRSWILGYKTVVVPKSIVYHYGGKTTKSIKNELAFHGLKNQLSMKITNFESTLAIKNLFLFFTLYGFKALKVFFDYKFYGSTQIKSTPYENKLAEKPAIKQIIRSLLWICTNQGYLWKKHQQVKSSRVLSTKDMQRKGIISSKNNSG